MNKTPASLFVWTLLACLATSCTDDSTPGTTADGGGTTDAPVSPVDSSTPDAESPEASTEASTDGGASEGSVTVDASDAATDGPTADGAAPDATSSDASDGGSTLDALLPSDALPAVDVTVPDVIPGG